MRYLKIVGICLGVIFGLLGVSIGIAAITGAFSGDPVHLSSIYFEVKSGGGDNPENPEGESSAQKVNYVYDVIQTEKTYTVSFQPSNATDLALTVTTEGDETIFENIPKTIYAGKPFTLKPVKNEFGANKTGSVCLKITNPYCSVDCLIYVAVDVLAQETIVNGDKNIDCFELTVDRDENYNVVSNSGISAPNSASVHYDYSFENSQPKTIWVNSVYADVLDIDTGGVFKEGALSSTSELFRTVDFKLLYKEEGKLFNLNENEINFDYEYVNNKHGYKLDIAPTKYNQHKEFILRKQIHRSYMLQKEFKDNGFDAFYEKYAGLDNESLEDNLEYRALCEKYCEFINKHIEIFGYSNQNINEIYTNYNQQKQTFIYNIDKIISSLEGVLITQDTVFRILDVEISSFTIDNSASWQFRVFEEKTLTIDEIVGNGISEYSLDFSLEIANNPNNNLSSAEITNILNNLKRSFEVEVYVKGLTGEGAGLNISNYNDGILRIDGYLNQNISEATKSSYEKYYYQQNFLDVRFDENSLSWVFSPNVPSVEIEDFEILIAFKISTYTLDNKIIEYYNFVPVSIYKTNIDGRLDIEANSVMYVNSGSLYSDYSGKTQDVSFSGINNFPGENVSSMVAIEYKTVMVFAEVESAKISDKKLNKIKLNSSQFYNFISVDDTTAKNITKDKNEILNGYYLGTIDVSEAGVKKPIQITAINASAEPVKLFAAVIFTDKEGNPIDRYGNIIDMNSTNTSGITLNVCGISALEDVKVKSAVDGLYYYTQVEMDNAPEGQAVYLMPNYKTGKIDVIQNGDVVLRNNNSSVYSTDYTKLRLVSGIDYEYLYVLFNEKAVLVKGSGVSTKSTGGAGGSSSDVKFEFVKEEDVVIEGETAEMKEFRISNTESTENNYYQAVSNLDETNLLTNILQVTINNQAGLSLSQIEEYVSLEYDWLLSGQNKIGVKVKIEPKKNCDGAIRVSSTFNSPLSYNEKAKFGMLNFSIASVELNDINAYSTGVYNTKFDAENQDFEPFNIIGTYDFNKLKEASAGFNKFNGETVYFADASRDVDDELLSEDYLTYQPDSADPIQVYKILANVGKLFNTKDYEIVKPSCFNEQQYQLKEGTFTDSLTGNYVEVSKNGSEYTFKYVENGVEITNHNTRTLNAMMNVLINNKGYLNSSNIIDFSRNILGSASDSVMSNVGTYESQISVELYFGAQSLDKVLRIFDKDYVVSAPYDWEETYLGGEDAFKDYFKITLRDNQLPFNPTYIASGENGEDLDFEVMFKYAPNLIFDNPEKVIMKKLSFNVKFLDIDFQINDENLWSENTNQRDGGLIKVYDYEGNFNGSELIIGNLFQNTGYSIEGNGLAESVSELLACEIDTYTNSGITASTSVNDGDFKVYITNSSVSNGDGSQLTISLSYVDALGEHIYKFIVKVNSQYTYDFNIQNLNDVADNNKQVFYYESSDNTLNIMVKDNSGFEVNFGDMITVSGKKTIKYYYKNEDNEWAKLVDNKISKDQLFGNDDNLLINKDFEFEVKATVTTDDGELDVFYFTVRIFPEYSVGLNLEEFNDLYYGSEFAFSGTDLTNYLMFERYNSDLGVYTLIEDYDVHGTIISNIIEKVSFDFDSALGYLKNTHAGKSYFSGLGNVYEMFYNGDKTEAYKGLAVKVDGSTLNYSNFEQTNLTSVDDKDMKMVIPLQISLENSDINGLVMILPAFLYNLEFDEENVLSEEYDKKNIWKDEDSSFEIKTNIVEDSYVVEGLKLVPGRYNLDVFFNYSYDKNFYDYLNESNSDRYIIYSTNYDKEDNSIPGLYKIGVDNARGENYLEIYSIPAGGLEIILTPDLCVYDTASEDSRTMGAKNIIIKLDPMFDFELNKDLSNDLSYNIENNAIKVTTAEGKGITGEYDIKEFFIFTEKAGYNISELSVSYSLGSESKFVSLDGDKLIIKTINGVSDLDEVIIKATLTYTIGGSTITQEVFIDIKIDSYYQVEVSDEYGYEFINNMIKLTGSDGAVLSGEIDLNNILSFVSSDNPEVIVQYSLDENEEYASLADGVLTINPIEPEIIGEKLVKINVELTGGDEEKTIEIYLLISKASME